MKEIASPKPDRLQEIIPAFSESCILVIGDAMLDNFILGTVNRISPEAPVPIVEVEGENLALGGAANVANNIVSLGGKALLAGVVGGDPQGESLRNMLNQKGIVNEGLVKDPLRPTTQKSRIMAHQQQVVRVDREIKHKISSEIEDRLINYAKSIINQVKAIIISDYSKGVITLNVMAKVLSLCKKNNILLSIDPKEDNFKLYKEPYVITPNQKETEVISGIKIFDESSLMHAGKQLMETTNCHALLITRGAKGMNLFARDKEISVSHIPASAREVYDVTGAGDTVISTLTLALCSGSSLEEAAWLANYAAGMVVGKLGTATISPSELIDTINCR